MDSARGTLAKRGPTTTSNMTNDTCQESKIHEITMGIEVIALPSESNGVNNCDRIESVTMEDKECPLDRPFTLPTPQPTDHRPFDELGPPSDPLEFPMPQFHRGRRADVLCYVPANDQHIICKNALFRDYSREYDGRDDADNQVQEAYWPIPSKQTIKTIMGHVEICIALERCRKQQSSQDEDDESSGDGEEDIVFEMTERRVAVKVNYGERMEKLRHKHAEDPLKEISAMQLIGDQNPHVLGCTDVLFDGKNLNVVMRYCDSGDFFELLQASQQGEVPGMSEGHCRYWFRQLMCGVQYLHSIGICHRDISPENIMVDQNGCLIIDMGMSLRVPYLDPKSPGQVTDVSRGSRRCLFRPQGACGKLPYMSPEIFKNRASFDGEAADVFTCGVILFCMLTGNRSYQQPHPSDAQFYWMTSGLSQLLDDWGVHLSPEGLHILQNLLQVNPRMRLTLDEIFTHPWLSLPDEHPQARQS